MGKKSAAAKQNSEDPSGSIRDIPAHLIHDKNDCLVLSKNRVVTSPDGSIGVTNFYFFDPGDFGPRGQHRPDPEVKIRRSKGLNPSFYVVFYVDFDKRHKKVITQANDGL